MEGSVPSITSLRISFSSTTTATHWHLYNGLGRINVSFLNVSKLQKKYVESALRWVSCVIRFLSEVIRGISDPQALESFGIKDGNEWMCVCVCVCFNICKMHKREKIYGNMSSNKMGVSKGGFWLWLVARLSWRQTDLHAATAFCPSRKVTHTNQLRRPRLGTCLNNNPSTWTPFHISIILFFFFFSLSLFVIHPISYNSPKHDKKSKLE